MRNVVSIPKNYVTLHNNSQLLLVRWESRDINLLPLDISIHDLH